MGNKNGPVKPAFGKNTWSVSYDVWCGATLSLFSSLSLSLSFLCLRVRKGISCELGVIQSHQEQRGEGGGMIHPTAP